MPNQQVELYNRNLTAEEHLESLVIKAREPLGIPRFILYRGRLFEQVKKFCYLHRSYLETY